MSAVLAASPFDNGGWIFLAFVVLFTVAVIYTLYSRAGSGITPRSYGKRYQGAPGARGESRMSGRRNDEIKTWTRGTR